jgi:hypothetical protein
VVDGGDLPVPRPVDHHEAAATDAAGERLGDPEHGRRGHRGVDRVAAPAQHADRGLGGEGVDGGGGAAVAGRGVRPGRRAGHRRRRGHRHSAGRDDRQGGQDRSGTHAPLHRISSMGSVS